EERLYRRQPTCRDLGDQAGAIYGVIALRRRVGMTEPFRTTRRVEFRDTDAAGIVHFSAFFYYMESVEHEFLRQLGLSVLSNDETSPISWPRVSATCDFQSAVRFEDVLDISLR